MSDNVQLGTPVGTGDVCAADDVGGVKYQRVKVVWGVDGTVNDASASNPIPISDAAGSLTVDAPVGTPAFVRLSDGAAAITTLPVSIASVPSHAVTNAGTFATQESGTQVQVDDAVFTPATSKIQVVGYTADETATDSVDEGDAGAARMTLDRKQIMTPYAHAAAGGVLPFKNLDCDESEDSIKTSAGKLFWIHAVNLTASKRYLKLYDNTVAGVSVGTTVPDLTFPIPTLGDTNGAGFCVDFGPHGMQFLTAITVAATTGFADNDSGAPGTNDVIINGGYI